MDSGYIPAMQTLGVSNSTPQSESRLKNIFWPTIRSATDVDTLGTQGFWICVIVAVLALGEMTILGQPMLGLLMGIYFYLGGVGVREHNVYSAIVVFIMFLANTVASPGILNVILTAVLLSTLRATFIASFWEPGAADTEMPIRLSETWGDKFADQWPKWLWPKFQIVYYIYSACFLFIMLLGTVVIALRRAGVSIPLPPHVGH
jgi:hypothetical protein